MSRYDNIIAAIMIALARVRIEHGYQTDAGAIVHLREQYRTAPREMPCLILFPGDVTDTLDGETPPSQGEENHFLPIVVEGWIRDDESGAQGQKLRQDVLLALKKDPYFSGLTEGYSGPLTSSAEIEDGGDQGFLSFVRVEATIFYVTTYAEAGYGEPLIPATEDYGFFWVKKDED